VLPDNRESVKIDVAAGGRNCPPMLSFRPFSILAPRILQLFGWTYDPSSHVQPLLSPQDMVDYKKNATEVLATMPLYLQSKVSPTYVPPRFQPQPPTFQN
jgi:hypothetical protein